ncbi:Auxin Efflux Carrier [Ancylobacter novellus DSM 506]|uniref:Auxin Efflux Carrier n=1 Tax=Ancylobacter novellus (strain ATCC 8093 / DSM 506 / JCM 20403 / CCM 1077 / IAM 12100 / NBRC 12443 / NCIMB 10456) TaxID=639283 RepID=D7A9Q3_ANCN5|nr:AEC family transporter [Ancylobacter novellus]ADH88829.1 Auxin Efflux Carrier [Ancylobacter novellus DSM 506]
MHAVLGALVPVFLVIALGAALKRGLLPEASHWIALERLTYFVLFPALLVVSISRADLGEVAVVDVSTALLGAIFTVSALLTVLRRPICRVFGLAGPSYTSLFQGSVRWNTYIALAVSGALAGSKGLAVAAVGLAVMIPVLNAISVVVLARHGENGGATNRLLLQLARNPFIWSCIAGTLINAFDVPIPSVLVDFGDILGRASLALGLLVVGAGLRLGDLRRPRMATWFTCLAKLLIMPTLAVGIGVALGLQEIDLLIVAVGASVPSAPNGYVLARQMGGDAPLLAEMLTVQTILAAATMPAVIALVTLIAHL